MRVWYRFPDMDDDITISSERVLEQYVYEKNSEIICEMGRWFKSINERIPHPIRLERHNDILACKIKVGVVFEMREDLAVLFKMRFGDGTINYQ